MAILKSFLKIFYEINAEITGFLVIVGAYLMVGAVATNTHHLKLSLYSFASGLACFAAAIAMLHFTAEKSNM